MKSSLKTIAFAVATFLGAGTASAERPANLANTTWTLQTNLDTVQLFIDTQGGPGAPGAATCRTSTAISATSHTSAAGTARRPGASISCTETSTPATRSGSSLATCPTMPGQPLYMAGTMTVLISAFGDLGEYNFSATYGSPVGRGTIRSCSGSFRPTRPFAQSICLSRYGDSPKHNG